MHAAANAAAMLPQMLPQTRLHRRVYIGDVLVTIWMQRSCRCAMRDKVTPSMGIAVGSAATLTCPSTVLPRLAAACTTGNLASEENVT